jgi:hypothetical protein
MMMMMMMMMMVKVFAYGVDVGAAEMGNERLCVNARGGCAVPCTDGFEAGCDGDYYEK